MAHGEFKGGRDFNRFGGGPGWGHRGDFGRRGPGFFPFMIFGGLLKLLAAVALIMFGLRLLRRGGRGGRRGRWGRGHHGPGGGPKPWPGERYEDQTQGPPQEPPPGEPRPASYPTTGQTTYL